MDQMLKKGPEAIAVCILGMHRSGTSTVTRAVNLLGAYLGEIDELLAPGPDNPEGFWERKDIVALNERVLESFDSVWDSSVPLPEGWHRSEKARPFLQEAKAILNEKFRGCPFWAWKDPRTTLLVDLWQDALAGLPVNVKYVFVIRNPLDVARSLEKRNGLDTDKGMGVWFNYNITALKSVIDKDCAFILYDRIVEDWEGELKRCASIFGLPWPADKKGLEHLRAKMAEFVRPDLRHSRTSAASLKDLGLPAPVIELYETLLRLADGESRKALAEKTDRLWKDFSSCSAFFRYDAVSSIKLRKLEILAKENEVRYENLVRSLEQEIEAIMKSKSWRLTAPLRRILDLARGGRTP